MIGARFWARAAGCVIGCSLALFANALVHWLGYTTPATVGESDSGRPAERPAPAFPQSSKTPAPTPDRNHIQLPLTPAKDDSGPLQVEQPPFDPNAADANGVTPFMRAAERGDIALLEELLGKGAAVNQMDHLAHTALYFAIAAKSAPTVEWLIAHGAEVGCPCCDGTHSPLLHALKTRDVSLVEPILRAVRPLQWNTETRDALFTAIRLGDKPFVRAMLVYHQTAPTLEDARQPLLGYAIVWDDEPLLNFLLECGANPNTPLASPVERNFSRFVLERSLREYLETEPGMTPLMLAAGMNKMGCVEALLRYGAKRGTVTGHYKMTAIDFAARRDAPPEMLQVLLGKSPRLEDQRMRIDVSISRQQAVFYKDNQVALVTPISTGRPGFPTPTGQFVVTDKDRLHRSTLYPAYMPYFLRMSCRDFGLHAGELPGYPASHGCIRLPWSSAERLYRQVDIGTLVTISR